MTIYLDLACIVLPRTAAFDSNRLFKVVEKIAECTNGLTLSYAPASLTVVVQQIWSPRAFARSQASALSSRDLGRYESDRQRAGSCSAV